jgi:hypothetical protein
MLNWLISHALWLRQAGTLVLCVGVGNGIGLP